ncbi:hypothetical protein BKA62DRAFT_394938 [Auriculariales sp. MPI-PUGE-AT-0066]|nr:hypothetical protein BKA62DRAFT_394938 [Auriculariales sp. MPI-PUGE-AT-0066]
MERYSAFRDPGTGIQPFLTPVAPRTADASLATVLSPILYLLGALRTLLLLVLAVLHVSLVEPLKLVPTPPTRLVAHLLTAFTTRLALLILGVLWLPVELVSRRRQRASSPIGWNPRAGDVIVSNWVSIFELLWLAFRFDPVFTIPVISSEDSREIAGFRKASLWQIICFTSRTPQVGQSYEALERIRKQASRPIVVFPECTTSNGRGLLKFADVFQQQASVPAKTYQIFVMAIRYESPTTFQPSLSHSIPTPANPLSTVFRATATIAPASPSIRLLSARDGPSSETFDATEVIGQSPYSLAEICGTLAATTGKLKRTGQGWQEKVAFLQFHAKAGKRSQ